MVGFYTWGVWEIQGASIRAERVAAGHARRTCFLSIQTSDTPDELREAMQELSVAAKNISVVTGMPSADEFMDNGETDKFALVGYFPLMRSATL